MRAPISRQSKKYFHKMADLYGQLNSPQDFLLEKQNLSYFYIKYKVFSQATDKFYHVVLF